MEEIKSDVDIWSLESNKIGDLLFYGDHDGSITLINSRTK